MGSVYTGESGSAIIDDERPRTCLEEVFIDD